jgi:hypothetical protein
MSIVFLNNTDAFVEYLQTDYFDQMSIRELKYRLEQLNIVSIDPINKKKAKHKLINLYKLLINNFTNKEKNIIKHNFDLLFEIMKGKSPKLIPTLPIKLIKFNGKTDWNYPYTINHSIILTTQFINQLLDNEKEKKKKLVTLCHELIHLLQRNDNIYPHHASIFDSMYVNIFGFIKNNKSIIDRSGLNIVTNPDGYNYRWIVRMDGNKLFMPIVTSDTDHKLSGILCEIKEFDNNLILTNNWKKINDTEQYKSRFYGTVDQLYHPHEISCDLIAQYIVNNKIYSENDSHVIFYKYINDYLI